MSLYRIDKLFNFEKGTLQSSKCEPGSYTFITASAEWKTHNNFSYDCEALVFAAAASGSLGRTHYVNGKFIASDLCFVLTPKDPAKFPIDLRFYHIIFNELRSDIVKNTKAGTSKEAISLGNFARYELPYFEIEKQIEIKKQFVHSEKIKETLTSELTRQLDFVKQLRQSFLREAMQGKLVPQDPKDEPASELLQKIKAALRQTQDDKKGKKQKELPPVKKDEIPFDIPENWVWCRLGEIAISVSTGPFGTMLHKSDYINNGIPLVNPMNIIDGKIVHSEKMSINEETRARLKGYILEKGDIVIGRRGDMGRCAVVTEKENGWLCGTGSFFLKLYEFVDRDFFVKVLSSEYSKKSLLGSSVGATMNNLNHRILNNLLIPLSPLSEQHRIVAKLEQLMQLCDDLEQSIRQSKEQTNMLLQAALREALKGDEVEAPKE